ncbi:hypothetical protein DMB95_09215 [Campylobacter sp. MIT 12-8780]|uniref:BRO-N domain-containing protein n=1 Tax=unclassified Campylobacter TaxID=2593542 RepID=UPI00115CDDF0|nr:MULTISPECIES: BRO family protein [unclassified Campylobacter]NDJ28074.1 hypothetical protein [Campylobacter sp. MIT 19-121]TQR39961.1 hypothetical protein DMB95_09215 [Campylobacter sp. MIT 12-8780]
MKEIQIFKNENLGAIRIKGDLENPLFCLSDICKILGLAYPNKIANMIKKEFEWEELNSASFDTGYGVKKFTMITEPQLYFVLMRSDKPKAKPFRRWISDEVLPKIRKQGVYSPNDYINELMALLTPNIPPYDFSVKIDINDWHNRKELSLHYSVGVAKMKKEKKENELLNVKFASRETK